MPVRDTDGRPALAQGGHCPATEPVSGRLGAFLHAAYAAAKGSWAESHSPLCPFPLPE